MKMLKLNFNVVDNVITDKNVKSFVKNDYDPREVQSPLTKMKKYDLETYNKDRAVPSCSCL